MDVKARERERKQQKVTNDDIKKEDTAREKFRPGRHESWCKSDDHIQPAISSTLSYDLFDALLCLHSLNHFRLISNQQDRPCSRCILPTAFTDHFDSVLSRVKPPNDREVFNFSKTDLIGLSHELDMSIGPSNPARALMQAK